VVVRDFNFVRITLTPGKTDPPLIVDSNTFLPLAVPVQTFEAIPVERRENADYCPH
jgi:hypothetical protein